jgi:hypothetical protein
MEWQHSKMDIITSVLPMLLDVYVQADTQDPDTGAMIKEFQYRTTLNCSAKGIISNSATSRGGDRQVMTNKYTNEQMIQIRTIEKLNIRHKITAIRDKNNNYIWKELNHPTESPTVFEVIGVTPILDPFGTILAYSTTAKRSENQVIGV